MLALCVESSFHRGMGHFYRALVVADHLRAAGADPKIYINDHAPALDILKARGFDFSIVDVSDVASGWEADVVRRDGIRVWINDRLDTDARHAARIKALGLPLATFDDRGSGAELADVHIAGLALDPEEPLTGRRVLRGLPYVVLDPAIARFRRIRQSPGSVVVTLGGADTHGVTLAVLRLLAAAGRAATVVTGPAFADDAELSELASHRFRIKKTVPSLIEEFSHHELAITAGGITPFEAGASGLPCIIIASEDFEVPIGKALARLGTAAFAGHRSRIDASVLTRELPLESMSRAGLEHIGLDGARRIAEVLLSL